MSTLSEAIHQYNPAATWTQNWTAALTMAQAHRLKLEPLFTDCGEDERDLVARVAAQQPRHAMVQRGGRLKPRIELYLNREASREARRRRALHKQGYR